MSWSKHKKILAMAKGYRGRANSCYRTAINRVEKGLQYQYRDRKQKKRVRFSLFSLSLFSPCDSVVRDVCALSACTLRERASTVAVVLQCASAYGMCVY